MHVVHSVGYGWFYLNESKVRILQDQLISTELQSTKLVSLMSLLEINDLRMQIYRIQKERIELSPSQWTSSPKHHTTFWPPYKARTPKGHEC